MTEQHVAGGNGKFGDHRIVTPDREHRGLLRRRRAR